MARKKYKGSPHLQILFKEHWRQFNNGGMWLEYVEDKAGENLLTPTTLEDIKPGKLYYMQQVLNRQHFHPAIFDPVVEWNTIKELHNTGRIWQLKEDQHEQKDTDMNSRSETSSKSLDGQEQ